ncbi:IS1096 element passenger TnpR family protein, partial [Actinomadura welshii]
MGGGVRGRVHRGDRRPGDGTAGPGLGRWLGGAPQDVLTIWAACTAESLGLTGEGEPEDTDYLVVLATLYEQGGTASGARLLAAFDEMGAGPAACDCPDCAALQRSSGQGRLDALALARACGPEAALAWREWAARDGFGAHARLWLAEVDGTEPAELDEAWAAVDTLTVMLDTLAADAPAEFLPTVLQAAAGPELTHALPLLDECGHPDAPRLVALLGGVPEPLPPPGPAATYQLKIQLRNVTKPPVWRRLRLPAGITLDRLHEVVQAA